MKSNLAWFGYKIYEERIWPQDKLQQLIAIFIKIEVRKIDEGDFNVLLSIEIKMVEKSCNKCQQEMTIKGVQAVYCACGSGTRIVTLKGMMSKNLSFEFWHEKLNSTWNWKQESNLYLPLFIKNWFKHLCSAYVHEMQTSLS